MNNEFLYEFNIGDIETTIAVSGEVWRPIAGYFDKFSSAGIPQAIYRVSELPPPAMDSDSLVLEYGRLRIFHKTDRWLISIGSEKIGRYWTGIFTENYQSGDIFTPPFLLRNQIQNPIRPLLYTCLMSRGLGVLMHASGITFEDKGIMFCGNSGNGKSTTARLWYSRGDSKVLCDDRIILREIDSQFRIYGTPWPNNGGLFANLHTPLKAIFFLYHAYENKIRPLKGMEVINRLINSSFLPVWDPKGMEYILTVFEKISIKVPCFDFGFTPTPDAVDFTREYLANL
jgi:hypothetical protein